MCIGLHVQHPLLLSELNKTWIFSTDFRKILKFHENLFSGSGVFPCGQTDRHTDMTNLIVVSRSISNASKTQQPVSSGTVHRVRRRWSTGPTLEMFGKGKGRLSPVLSYAPYYEVNGDSGGVAPHINIGIRCR